MRFLISALLACTLTCGKTSSVSADFLEIELSGQIGSLVEGDDLHGFEGAGFEYKFLFDLTEPPCYYEHINILSFTDYAAVGGFFRLTGTDDLDSEYLVGTGNFEKVSLRNFEVQDSPDSLSLRGSWPISESEVLGVATSIFFTPDFFPEAVTEPTALTPFENSEVIGFGEFIFVGNNKDAGRFEVVNGFARGRIVVPEPGVTAILTIACMVVSRNSRRKSFNTL